jgi:hypothetical protein
MTYVFFICVSDLPPFNLNPDPAKNLNARPDSGCQANEDLNLGSSVRKIGNMKYENVDIFSSFYSTDYLPLFSKKRENTYIFVKLKTLHLDPHFEYDPAPELCFFQFFSFKRQFLSLRRAIYNLDG